MKHDARVRQVNPRVDTFRVKRNGRFTGNDHRHTCDGYQAYCRSCDWVGEITGTAEASADAAGHNQLNMFNHLPA